MLDTVVPLLTARLALAGVAVAAVALSSSAVVVTTMSDHEALPEEAPVSAPDGALDQDPVATDDSSGPVDTEPSDEQPAAPVEDVAGDGGELEAAPHGDPDLPPCPADAKNHGAYVSSVAEDRSAGGREHGARVSAAARSDCGKPAGDAEGDGTEPAEDESGEVEAQRAPAPPAERKATKAQAKAEKKAAGPAEGKVTGGQGKGDQGKGGGRKD